MPLHAGIFFVATGKSKMRPSFDFLIFAYWGIPVIGMEGCGFGFFFCIGT
jgi:hypothetical protein